MKRQGLQVTILELQNIIEDLENQSKSNDLEDEIKENLTWQLNIINKTPEQSDTWEIEK